LLNTVANLVEYPHPVLGEFSKDFLALPNEALITSMKYHQKYFYITDDKGHCSIQLFRRVFSKYHTLKMIILGPKKGLWTEVFGGAKTFQMLWSRYWTIRSTESFPFRLNTEVEGNFKKGYLSRSYI